MKRRASSQNCSGYINHATKDSLFGIFRYLDVPSFKSLQATDAHMHATCVQYIDEGETLYYYIKIGQMQGAFSSPREIQYLTTIPDAYYRAYRFYENAARLHFAVPQRVFRCYSADPNLHTTSTMRALSYEFFRDDRKFYIPEWFYSKADLEDRNILNLNNANYEFQNVEFGYAVRKTQYSVLLYHIESQRKAEFVRT